MAVVSLRAAMAAHARGAATGYDSVGRTPVSAK